ESILVADVRHRVCIESGDVLDPIDTARENATTTTAPMTVPTSVSPAPTDAVATKLNAQVKNVGAYLERVGFHGAHVSARAIVAHGEDPSQVDVDVVVFGGHWVHVHDVVAEVHGVRASPAYAPSDASGSGTSLDAPNASPPTPAT